MMRVLIIDPWGVKNTAEYLSGLISGVSELTQLMVVTNFYSACCNKNARIYKWFFRLSEEMKNNRSRKLMRGVEYVYTYQKILKLAGKEHFDVIHINWLLFYKLDILFLHLLKRCCGKIVYTAHNAIPHIGGENKVNDLKKIYGAVDRIIVHGEAVKSEILKYFPTVEDKIVLQMHGVVLSKDEKIEYGIIPPNIMEKCKRYGKIFLMCGDIYPNKGTDRILKIWMNNYLQEDALLLIAGKQKAPYPEYEELESLIERGCNVEILNKYVEEELMDALFSVSTAVLIPYRHASMSGTVFSAARFAKVVLCTDVGSLPEYLEADTDSIICENSDNGITGMLKKALNMDKDILINMGDKLQKNINKKCDWKAIGEHIVRDIY